MFSRGSKRIAFFSGSFGGGLEGVDALLGRSIRQVSQL